MSSKHPSGRVITRGFTMIEVLTVVGIIFILVTMSLVSIGKMREQSAKVQCANNLRNLQIAAMTYMYDAAGDSTLGSHLPAAYSTEQLNGDTLIWSQSRVGWVDWVGYASHGGGPINYTTVAPRWWGSTAKTSITNGSLWKYVGNSYKVYFCPAIRRSSALPGLAPDGTTYGANFTNVYRTYVMSENCHLRVVGNMTTGSRMVLFADGAFVVRVNGVQIASRHMNTNNAFAYDGVFTGNSAGTYPTEAIGPCHPGTPTNKGNAVFVDGHVEQIMWNTGTNAYAGIW